MKYSEQIVFKNDLAIRKALMFIESKELKGLEKQNLQQQVIEERKTASQRANQLIRERR